MTVAESSPRLSEQEILERTRDLVQQPAFREEALACDRENRFPFKNVQLLREAGLLLLPLPRSYGGLNPDDRWLGSYDIRLLNKVLLEISKVCSSTAQSYFVHAAMVRTILDSGSEEIKQLIAKALVDEQAFVSGASSEMEEDVTKMSTTYREVEGGYLVNGRKYFATGHGGASYLVVAAIKEGSSSPSDARRFALRSDAPGVRDYDDWDCMGQRGTTSGSIGLENVFVPKNWMLGYLETQVGPYFGPLYQLGFASIFIGLAYGALQEAMEYIRTRTRPWPTAGTARATDDPYIRRHIGQLVVQTEAAEGMLDRAHEVALGVRDGRFSRAELSVAAAKARVAANQATLEVTQRVFELCGARSSFRDVGLDRFMRNARTLTLHDPVDYKLKEIGGYTLVGEEPRVWF